MQDQIFTRSDAATYLRVSKSLLAKLAMEKAGPRFSRLGRNAVRYRKEDLDAWIAECRENRDA